MPRKSSGFWSYGTWSRLIVSCHRVAARHKHKWSGECSVRQAYVNQLEHSLEQRLSATGSCWHSLWRRSFWRELAEGQSPAVPVVKTCSVALCLQDGCLAAGWGRHPPRPRSTRYRRLALGVPAAPIRKFSGLMSPCTNLQQAAACMLQRVTAYPYKCRGFCFIDMGVLTRPLRSARWKSPGAARNIVYKPLLVLCCQSCRDSVDSLFTANSSTCSHQSLCICDAAAHGRSPGCCRAYPLVCRCSRMVSASTAMHATRCSGMRWPSRFQRSQRLGPSRSIT